MCLPRRSYLHPRAQLEAIKAERGGRVEDGAVAPSKPLAEVLREAKEAKEEAFQAVWRQMKTGALPGSCACLCGGDLNGFLFWMDACDGRQRATGLPAQQKCCPCSGPTNAACRGQHTVLHEVHNVQAKTGRWMRMRPSSWTRWRSTSACASAARARRTPPPWRPTRSCAAACTAFLGCHGWLIWGKGLRCIIEEPLRERSARAEDATAMEAYQIVRRRLHCILGLPWLVDLGEKVTVYC